MGRRAHLLLAARGAHDAGESRAEAESFIRRLMQHHEKPVAYSVVVPLYNEQESVPPLYVKIIDVMDSIGEPFEIVFVDDGSKDGTFRMLSEIARDDHRVIVVRLRRNFGQTAALKAGFDHSLGEIIISLDGDLQHAHLATGELGATREKFVYLRQITALGGLV